MENYFWVAVQNHFLDNISLHNGHRSGDRGWNIDVLALVGPNKREVDIGEKKKTCLVKAIMARAFEITLLVERQSSMPPLKGYWLDTAKSLVGDVAKPPCKIRPCPLHNSGEFQNVSDGNCCLSHRIQVDVSDCDSGDVDILKWALADLEAPLTALGRAWGGERYALIGALDCTTGETQSVPVEIWARFLSLLVRLGVNDLTIRLERAAAFVWFLVDCPVHEGLADATVIDLAEEDCRCSVCIESRPEGTREASQEEVFEARGDCLPDEFTRKWSGCEGKSTITDGVKKPLWFKLHLSAMEINVCRPTVESLKLTTVKMLAQLVTFRANLGTRLSRAGVKSADLPQEILHREIDRTLRSSGVESVAASLLEDNPSCASRDLVLRIKGFPSRTFNAISKLRMKSISGRSHWMRLEVLRDIWGGQKYHDHTDILLKPCRLFTVSAVDNPLLHSDDCNLCPELSPNTIVTYDSTLELSTTGQYGCAIWMKV